MEKPGTVSSVGIARLAGVGRAAVSNWRRRYADFPQPSGGTATSPAFDLGAVEKWLTHHGKLAATTGAQQAWREIEAVSGGPDLGEALWLAGAWLFTRWIDTEDGTAAKPPSPSGLIKAVRAVDPPAARLLGVDLPEMWAPRQQAVLAAVAGLRSEAAAFDDLYRQYLLARGASSDYATPAGVARLMLEVAGPAKRVMDLACGTGSLVTQAVVARSPAPVQCFAQDIDATAAKITQVRLLFAHRLAQAGGPASVVRVGDSLRSDAFPGQLVDLVVSNPPFGLHDWSDERLAYDPRWEYGGLPPRTEPELAWVQDALAHLEPGGLAVLLMPPGAAFRSAGRRIRAELLRRGALRAVIGLPPRMLPVTSIPLQLWILRRPAAGRSTNHVLFVDTSIAADSGKPDVAAVTETVVRLWRSFDADPAAFEELEDLCRAVPVIDLLDEEVNLSPARYLPVAGGKELDASGLLVAHTELCKNLRGLERLLPTLTESEESPLVAARRVSLDELSRSSGLMIHRGPSRSSGADDEVGQLAVTGRDVIHGSSPSGAATAPGIRIEPGDVLIPVIARSLIARVATEEQVGALLGWGVQAIRADPDLLDPWFLAGVLGAMENVREAARTSSTVRDMVRVNVKRLQVPLLPLDAQRPLGRTFRQLAEFESALGQTYKQSMDLSKSLSVAMSSGLLVPETE